jgi:calcineurin-like phosphoesterase family protein
MQTTFIISDTHFGHQNMYGFTDDAGNPARFPYTSADECDAVMFERWNAVVKPTDKVYHLGDVAIKRTAIKTMASLNGTKVLIRGNHDIFQLSDYTPYFKDIRGSHKLGDFILSHYPIHTESLRSKWCKGNIHGHVHLRDVLNSPLHFNACVEMTNYSPIPFDDIVSIMSKRKLPISA